MKLRTTAPDVMIAGIVSGECRFSYDVVDTKEGAS